MNVRRAVMPVVCLLAAAGSAFAQHRVDPTNMYSRIYAIVPMIGSGTWEDPRRPAIAPFPSAMTPGSRAGIIAFNSIESDDGNFALVEIVTASRPQLTSLMAQIRTQLSAAPGFQLFDRSVTSPATVQAAFQLLKKNFDIAEFRVVVP